MNLEIGKTLSYSLDNGLGIFTCRNSKAPIATFQAWARTGSINEGRCLGSGLSHFLEHFTFKGTKKYNRNQITAGIDRIGGRMNAYTSYSQTVFYADCPSAKIAEAADIIMELVRNPLFPEDEFEKEKDVIMRERAMRSDSPDTVLVENLMGSMFIKNPMRHPIIGYANKIYKVRRDDLIDYHRQKYRPENLFIVVCGDIDNEQIFDIIKNKFGDWENSSYFDEPLVLDELQRASREKKFFFNDPLARIAVSYHAPPLSDPLSPAFDVLSLILGGNESSRLRRKIEREKKLSVSLNCFHHASHLGGIFCISASAEHSKLESVREAMAEELSAATEKNPPSDVEVKRAVAQISCEFLKSLRNIDTVAGLLGNSVLYYQDPKYALRYLELLKQLTPAKILEAAKSRLNNENSTTVIMLQKDTENKISPKLKSSNENPKMKIQIIESDSAPRILYLPDKSLPLFDIYFLTKAGALFENTENAGISSIFSSLLSAGTSKYDEEKIIEIIDNNAIDLSFDDGKNTISASLTAPSESFDICLELLSEIFANPLFPEDIIEREKIIEINSIQSEMLSPLKAAGDMIARAFYKSHPYSTGFSEKLNSIPKLSKNALLNFYKSIFLSGKNAVFAIAGNISDKELEKIRSMIKSIPWTNNLLSEPPPPAPLKSHLKTSLKLPREQTVVTLSFPACGTRSRDNYLLNLASSALNGMNSTLFKHIREENGMAYYTGFAYKPGINCGHITLYAGISQKDIQKTIDIFKSECDRMLNHGALSQEEFSSAKEKILFHICEAQANSRDWLAGACAEELIGHGIEDFENSEEIYKAFTLNELNSTIAKYISAPTTVEIIVLGSVKQSMKKHERNHRVHRV